MQSAWATVAVFGAAAVPDALGVDAFDGLAAVVSIVLFLCSLPVWVYAFGKAVVRSAHGDDIAVSGLFFLAGSAPSSARRNLLGATAASIAVAGATAAADPFGVLVPMLHLGLAGCYGARHGVYPQRAASHTPKGGRR